MTLLELAQDLGMDLKKTSLCKGGEYHGACPSCGEGVDRFVIWPEVDRYWCRRCDVSGDSIQFCREFLNMSFREACFKLNARTFLHNQGQIKLREQVRNFSAQDPSKVWQEKASVFVDWAHKLLGRYPQVLEELFQRGFKGHTIEQFKLGYSLNPAGVGTKDFFRERSEWGLPSECKVGGQKKKLWLPSGLVIPTTSADGRVIKLKVRRQEWQSTDPLPKYIEISGSKSCSSIYGDITCKVAVVLESELDAILIQQEVKELCFCVALGGATKRPDHYTDCLLRGCNLILWSLDNDEAGSKVALWWREKYPHLRFWTAPIGKSPGDAFKDHGICLHDWILSGINYSKSN
jgi:DNA primase